MCERKIETRKRTIARIKIVAFRDFYAVLFVLHFYGNTFNMDSFTISIKPSITNCQPNYTFIEPVEYTKKVKGPCHPENTHWFLLNYCISNTIIQPPIMKFSLAWVVWIKKEQNQIKLYANLTICIRERDLESNRWNRFDSNGMLLTILETIRTSLNIFLKEY